MVTESIEGLTLDKLIKQQHYINLINKVKDVDGAIAHCKELNIDISDLLNEESKTPSIIAYTKLKIIIRSLNEGWKPNWNDGHEYKYWNYFYMDNGTFSFTTLSHYSYLYVPSALFLKTAELAKHVIKIAFEEYKTYYLEK